jgi:hypothetical protein
MASFLCWFLGITEPELRKSLHLHAILGVVGFRSLTEQHANVNTPCHETSLSIIQDAPRGGPHPRVSTKLTPDGVFQVRFRVGFCPAVNALMGEDVQEPAPIAEWFYKLNEIGTMRLTMVQFTPLPFGVTFDPDLLAVMPPHCFNAILQNVDLQGI